MRGGYLIIDLKNREFTNGVGQVFEGVYESIESSKKPVRITNLNIDGTEHRDVSLVAVGVNESSFTSVMPIGETQYNITISDRDIVTITTL